jgi:hypothetical protein
MLEARGVDQIVYPKQKQTEKQLINQNILKVDLQREGQSKERSSDEKI